MLPMPSAGSATVILAAAGTGGIVHVANLGDCGVRIVRDGECSFASTVRDRGGKHAGVVLPESCLQTEA